MGHSLFWTEVKGFLSLWVTLKKEQKATKEEATPQSEATKNAPSRDSAMKDIRESIRGASPRIPPRKMAGQKKKNTTKVSRWLLLVLLCIKVQTG